MSGVSMTFDDGGENSKSYRVSQRHHKSVADVVRDIMNKMVGISVHILQHGNPVVEVALHPNRDALYGKPDRRG
jgi:hypothetical protein